MPRAPGGRRGRRRAAERAKAKAACELSTLRQVIAITMNGMKDLLKWFALHSAESSIAVVAVIGGLWIILALSDNLYVCLPVLAFFETAMLWLAVWASRRR